MALAHAEIAKLELNRGDVLLVRVPPTWTPSQREHAQRGLELAVAQTGSGARVLFGTNDVDFTILRKSEDEERV